MIESGIVIFFVYNNNLKVMLSFFIVFVAFTYIMPKIVLLSLEAVTILLWLWLF